MHDTVLSFFKTEKITIIIELNSFRNDGCFLYQPFCLCVVYCLSYRVRAHSIKHVYFNPSERQNRINLQINILKIELERCYNADR